jgi:hypothetical protein
MQEAEGRSIWRKEPLFPTEVKLTDLKKGDRITRIRPAKVPLLNYPGKIEDISFIGGELIFLGLKNGCIFLERSTQAEKMMFGATVRLPLHYWSEGWAIYQEPEFLEETNMFSAIEYELNTKYEETLQQELQTAVEEDDFEKADLITKKLEEIKKKREEYKSKNPLPAWPNIQMFNRSGYNNGYIDGEEEDEDF